MRTYVAATFLNALIKMKLAFILFILGFMVLLSEQQRFPYSYRTSSTLPWSYLDSLRDADLYSFMLARKFNFPLNPLLLSHRNNDWPNNYKSLVVSGENPSDAVNLQSRNNGGVKQMSFQHEDAQVDPRFLFNYVATIGSTNSLFNALQKTIYYFTTSTSTTTSTTTCITTAAFTSSSFTVICRKRRELLEFLSALDNSNDEMKMLEPVSPSNVIEVMPTADPTTVVEQIQLESSKDDKAFTNENLGGSLLTGQRDKRFFVSTTIVTTYIFSTVTTTRTLSSNFADAEVLTCRPVQFTYC